MQRGQFLITTILTFVLFAVLSDSTAFAAEGGPEAYAAVIPSQLKVAARKLFDEGKVYFLWCDQAQPIKIAAGSAIEVPLKYAVRPATAADPFATAMELRTIDSHGKNHLITVISRGRTEGTDKKEIWCAVGSMFYSPAMYLKGNGEATLYLIKETEINWDSSSRTVISNSVGVQLVLE